MTHHLWAEINGNRSVTLRITCVPRDAGDIACRMVCTKCDGNENGCAHEIVDGKECMVELFLGDSCDIEDAYAGDVTIGIHHGMEIQPTWDGEGYTWQLPTAPARTARAMTGSPSDPST